MTHQQRIGWFVGFSVCLGFGGAPDACAATPEQLKAIEAFQRGEALWRKGKLAESVPEYQRAVTLGSAAFGPRSAFASDMMYVLGHIYFETGQFDKAEPLYTQSLSISEVVHGPKSRDLAIRLNNLAELDRVMGRYDQAEPLYRRCLAIKEALLGRDHPNVALTLNNLADLYRDMGRFQEAEPLYRRCLATHEKAIQEKTLDPDHPQVATAIDNLAHLYARMDQYEKAVPLAERALKLFEARSGPDHRDVAICVNNLGCMYDGLGRFPEAERLYRRSLATNERQLGPDHPAVIMNWDNLARVHAQMGRWDEAVREQERAQRASRRHVNHALAGLSESEQLSFLRNIVTDHLHIALGLGLTRRADPAAVEASAGWVLNGKALAQETLAQRALLARDRRDVRLAAFADQLNTVRKEWAALSVSQSAPGQEAARARRLEELAAREQVLSKRLAEARDDSGRDDPWVGLDEVRKALPDDAVLVEIARFRVWNFGGVNEQRTWQPSPRYAAWIIPPAGRGGPQLIDLGPSGTIEEAVAAVRRKIQPEEKLLKTEGEPEAEKQVIVPLRTLAGLVLDPLLPHIKGVKRWIVSPDAALWLVPWAALPLDGSRYAIEDHTIEYVVSGRDLGRRGAGPSTGRALVLADPDYDLDPAQARDAARKVLRDPAPPPAADPTRRGLSATLGLGAAPRLPGTAREAQAITPGLRAFAQSDPIVYTDRWALEAVFKACERPSVVVLSTHGFFLDAAESSTEHESLLDLGQARPRAGPPLNNPLLRCGLLLAGCNRHPTGEFEDGVLTGLEIVGTDLRGTDLVVLSACETGLGQVRNGEGVAGLRQAFQLAGARSVVATLWQVPDKESARLMTGFFDQLAAHQGKAEALREAQLVQIKSRRARFGAAHPFFWAAYTLTGRTR